MSLNDQQWRGIAPIPEFVKARLLERFGQNWPTDFAKNEIAKRRDVRNRGKARRDLFSY